jgi:hypothetical protein
VDVLEHPVFVAPLAGSDPFSEDDTGALELLLNRIAGCSGAPEFEVVEAYRYAELTPFESIISNRLRDCGPYQCALRQADLDLSAVDAVIQSTIRESFEHRLNSAEIRSFDGAVLKAYAVGSPVKPAVMIIPACGIPAKLCELWIDFLARDHFVLIGNPRSFW